MTFEELEKEVERIKEKSAETNKRLDALEKSYASLEKIVKALEYKHRWII